MNNLSINLTNAFGSYIHTFCEKNDLSIEYVEFQHNDSNLFINDIHYDIYDIIYDIDSEQPINMLSDYNEYIINSFTDKNQKTRINYTSYCKGLRYEKK